MKQARAHTTQSCKHSCVNSILPTHSMLLYKGSAAFSSSISKSCRAVFIANNTLKNTHNFDCHPERRPTAQSRAPCRLLGSSRDKLSSSFTAKWEMGTRRVSFVVASASSLAGYDKTYTAHFFSFFLIFFHFVVNQLRPIVQALSV